MAKKGDMLYAWTTDKEIATKAECGGAVTGLWKYALENKFVDAVLAVSKGQDLYDAVPTLITDPKDLDQDRRLAPLRDAAHVKARKKVPRRFEHDEDRGHRQGLRRDGALRACQAAADQPRQRRHDRGQLRRVRQSGHGPEDDHGEVRGRPGHGPQGRDRQGPVHHRVRGRAQGHLDGRARGARVRPPVPTAAAAR